MGDELSDMYADPQGARDLERFYQSPEIVAQRMATLDVLQPEVGERILDVGCGPALLVRDLASAVGRSGLVAGIDDSEEMIALAHTRCADRDQVRLEVAHAERLPFATGSFDAATCVQVLLYVPDVAAALAEMHRVVRPGGRVAIMETDWRGIVLSTGDPALSERITAVWDAVVPSPHLPSRLGGMLRATGFDAVRIRAVPIINTSYTRGRFAHGMIQQFAELAVERDELDAERVEAWLDDFDRIEADGAFFCCVNRFLFSAVKVGSTT